MTNILYKLRNQPKIAIITIRIIAMYILLGAIAKVLWGAPSDLPASLIQMMSWDEQNLFDAVIFVELFAACLVIISPRIGWPLISAVLTGFVLVLFQQLLSGEEACGCFGSSFTVPTPVMFGIDLIAVTCILLVQPWESLQTTSWRAWGFIPAPLLAALGVWYVHSATMAPVQVQPGIDDSALVTQIPNKLEDEQHKIESPPELNLPKEPIVKIQLPAPIESDWRLPARFPRNIKLHPPDWINKPLSEVELATWTDTSKMPDDCAIIFYYDTCTHCADHIKSVADSADEVNYVFVQLPTAPNNRFPKIIHSLPEGLHVKLPLGPRWQIKTPWQVEVKAGTVIEATQGF